MASVSCTALTAVSVTGHLRDAREPQSELGEARSEAAGFDEAAELGGRHADRGLPDAGAEPFEPGVVERRLDALAVGLAADPLLDVEQLRAAGSMLAVLREELVEQTLAVGELVDAELRMGVDDGLRGDRACPS